MAGEWKKPIFMHAISKMSISNWRFWQSVAISWKNLQFIVKILKVSGWVFSCYVSAVIFLDGPWLLTDSAGDRLLFSSSVKYARSLLFSWRVQSKSNQKLSQCPILFAFLDFAICRPFLTDRRRCSMDRIFYIFLLILMIFIITRFVFHFSRLTRWYPRRIDSVFSCMM